MAFLSRSLLTSLEVLSLVFIACTYISTGQAHCQPQKVVDLWKESGFPAAGTRNWKNAVWKNLQVELRNMGSQCVTSTGKNDEHTHIRSEQSTFNNFLGWMKMRGSSSYTYSGSGGLTFEGDHGLDIRANGMKVSIILSANGGLEIRLDHSNDEVVSFTARTGRKVEIRSVSRHGGMMSSWASIQLPKSINTTEARIEQIQNGVVIRGQAHDVGIILWSWIRRAVGWMAERLAVNAVFFLSSMHENLLDCKCLEIKF